MTYTLTLINDKTNGMYRINNGKTDEYYRLEENGIIDSNLRDALLVHAQIKIEEYNRKHESSPAKKFSVDLEEILRV